MFAAFKLSAVPININYNYVEGELNYVYNDARTLRRSWCTVPM